MSGMFFQNQALVPRFRIVGIDFIEQFDESATAMPITYNAEHMAAGQGASSARPSRNRIRGHGAPDNSSSCAFQFMGLRNFTNRSSIARPTCWQRRYRSKANAA